ncbi:hypothetical protein Taro_021707 [Colocasia esculenta]|uniref:Ribosomal protein L34Ae n=1 Tax=Colocasia esculenta TaxID=4460 RepID=A0A843US78_COLES|nr:hypothetical protein [Colocasia esculenta]
MDFFKVKRFGRYRKSKAEKDPDAEKDQLTTEELKSENGDAPPKEADADSAADMEDEDDDDFITNEVKRRLKELRKNSFMVLIPEESCPEEDEGEEEETSSSEWRESEVGDGHSWCDFNTLYSKYCERMFFFDKMVSQHLQNAGPQSVINRSPRYASKKLSLTCRSLYFKRKDEHQEESEYLQQQQDEAEDCYHNLETGYVAHICLAWEALHCQYMQLKTKISLQPDSATCYCFAAQAFQQFQVLLQRFIENEPFEPGTRVEKYTRARSSMPKLLQVPSYEGLELKDKEHDDLDSPVLAMDLLKVIEETILTFRLLLKTEKNKSSINLTSFGGHQSAASLHQVQISLDKKEIKLKELSKKKAVKKKSWPATHEEVELLFGLIDIKIVSRVLRMSRISKEQLLWCEEKMSKLGLSERKLERDGSPVLFPC